MIASFFSGTLPSDFRLTVVSFQKDASNQVNQGDSCEKQWRVTSPETMVFPKERNASQAAGVTYQFIQMCPGESFGVALGQRYPSLRTFHELFYLRVHSDPLGLLTNTLINISYTVASVYTYIGHMGPHSISTNCLAVCLHHTV